MADFAAQLKHATNAMAKRAKNFLRGLVRLSGLGGLKAYRPEAHYMRGPGPKWHEKHGHPATCLRRVTLFGDKWDD